MDLRARPAELARCPSNETECERWTGSSTCFARSEVSLGSASTWACSRVEKGSGGLPLIATDKPCSVELGLGAWRTECDS